MTRVLPHSLEAERSVVGAVLLGGIRVLDMARQAGLEAAAFYDPSHRMLWQTAEELDRDGVAIDPITMGHALGRDERTARMLKARGGPAWFGELMGEVVTVENVGHHAAIVVARAEARARIEAYQAAAAALYGGAEAEEVQADLERLHAARRGRKKRGPQLLLDVRRAALRRLEVAAEDPTHKTGIPTGIVELDLALGGGLQPGELSIAAGRPSMGKSAFGYGVAEVAARSGVPALFVSIEMTEQGLALRDLAAASGLDLHDLRTARLEQARTWRALHVAVSLAQGVPLWIDDECTTLDELLGVCRLWRGDPERGGQAEAALFVVDYLQLIIARLASGASREQVVSEISRALKALAKSTRSHVLALSQLNRAVEQRADKRPMLSDLRESGAIEQDADVVVFPFRPGVYAENVDPTEAEIIIAKQRQGPLKTVPVRWDGPRTRYLDAVSDAPPPEPPNGRNGSNGHRHEPPHWTDKL